MADQPLSTGGAIVQYTLTAADVDAILAEHGDPPRGMNRPVAGESYPAIVVRAWTPDNANLQVVLDGSATWWATSRPRAAARAGEPGTWH